MMPKKPARHLDTLRIAPRGAFDDVDRKIAAHTPGATAAAAACTVAVAALVAARRD
jgi:hypothetical protein